MAIRTKILQMLIIGGSAIAVQSNISFADECSEYGSPSYSAVRTLKIGNLKKIVSRVYVSGENEREEIKIDGHRVISIIKGGVIASYDPDTKQGWSDKIPADPGAKKGRKKKDPNIRIEEKKDGKTVGKVISRRIDGKWIEVFSFKCRKNGVLVEKRYPVPMKGGMGLAVLRHSKVAVKKLPKELFEVPKGIKIAKK